jgi:hypothetical protein
MNQKMTFVPNCTEMYRNRYKAYIGAMYRTVYRNVPICTDLYRCKPPQLYRNVPNMSIDMFRFGTKRVSVHAGGFWGGFDRIGESL